MTATLDCDKSHNPVHGDSTTTIALDAARIAQPEDQQALPSHILIVPFGDVASDAGSFVNDETAMQQIIKAFSDHGTELPIDYEHQTLGGTYSSPTGQAPAAGWIRQLVAIASKEDAVAHNLPHSTPGLWAEVSWTPIAEQQLRDKAYRYLSPVVLVRKDDRRIAALHSVALTNKPAIVGMTPVVNRDSAGAENGADALAVELIALRDALGLERDTDLQTLIATARQHLEQSAASEAERRAEARVEAALTAGKLCYAQREWALSLARRNPAEFDQWEQHAPTMVDLGVIVGRDSLDATGPSTSQAAAARSEWRANRTLLEKLCSEEAYTRAALRDGAATDV